MKPLWLARAFAMAYLLVSVALFPQTSSASASRSVRLNNYNNWTPPTQSAFDYSAKVRMLQSMDRLCMTESYSNSLGMTPTALKTANRKMRVFRLYDLCVKSSFESDFYNPSNTKAMQFPITKAVLDKNNWWLRDGNGNIVMDTGTANQMVDVGQPGFKEAFLAGILSRNAGKGFDGILFDYWWPGMITTFITSKGLPASDKYPNDSVWFNTAWQPFVHYVMDGLVAAGYQVVGNEAGEFNTQDPYQAWQRTMLDGVVYEQWAVGWHGEWLSGDIIEQRLAAFNADPLEAWTADFGLRSTDALYKQKAALSLAMYYIAIPSSTSPKFYHHFKDGTVFWETSWDFNIGSPAEKASQPYLLQSNGANRYFWKRAYTNGIVLLNYNSAGAGIRWTLSGRYVNVAGKTFSGTITVPPYTGLILQKR